jgi:cyclophilin family peptidyl-prolyl cis-trans isomerase
MEISDHEKFLGRIKLRLFKDVPMTSENFRCLCTGEKGKGKSGKKLHYKGNLIHKIVPNFLIQGGDVTNEDGTGGESIYGTHFPDENFKHKHNRPYMLGMANKGEQDTNSS